MGLNSTKIKLLCLTLVLFLILIPCLVSASDTPTIIWELPTPTDGSVSSSGNIYLNATITDDNETSSFIDWEDDILGFWNFESLNVTGVYDNSSNSNFMSYGGGISASDLIDSPRGEGLTFDGVNDYIKTTNVVVSNPTELTIGAWLYKTADGPSYECALHHATSSTIGSTSYWLGVDSSNYLTSTIGASTGGGWSIGKTTQLATYGQWWHIASAWDGTTVRVYVNGVYNKEYALATYNTLTTPTRMGASSDGANYQFKGTIDEVLIVERAFSADEMMALYNSSAHSLSLNLTDLAVGVYNYSAYAIDKDGNINISKQSVTVSVPIINSSDDTDTTGQDLNCYDTISDVIGSKFNATVRWYKDDILNLTLEYNNNYVDENIVISVLGSGNTSTGDIWKCDMKYYDGTAYSPVGTSEGLLIIELDPPLITWEDPTPNSGTSTLNDWVYVNTTITDFSDTYSFFDWDDSLLGYWSMDASSATGIYDNSSNGNFGSFIGTTLDEDDLITGKYGDALDLVGDTGHVAIDGDPFNEAYDEFSLSYWFKTSASTTASWQTAVHRNDGTSVGSSTWFGGLEVTSNQIVATIGAGSTEPTYMSGATGVVAVEDTWYYVVASWDGSNVKVYVDNVLKKTYALGTFTNKASIMRIGSSGGAGSGYMFEGVVDEVRISKRALSVEEINASYGEGRLYHNFTNLDLRTYNYSVYSIDVGGNLKISENREIRIAEDTCTVPGSGNWAITCSDNCIQNTDFSVPANITMTGTGTLTLNANMSFDEAHWEIYKEDGCEIVINSGGSIR